MTLPSLRADAEIHDHKDPLGHFRDRFILDPDVIYLDGNSLGPMLEGICERVGETLNQEWAYGLIRSWNEADWINLPETIAKRIAPIIGTHHECVTVVDSTSINLFKTLSAALSLNANRRKIVSEAGNFPTDLYMAEGLCDFLQKGHRLLLAENDRQITELFDDDTAVVMLTHVDFRTGRMLDMEKITNAAHKKGALIIWDLAHSAGAVPLQLDRVDADFAVGCGYKYLNGGPGAPSFVYVNKKHIGKVRQPLTGWFSHRQPFAFDQQYRASDAIKQFLCGTPPVLSMVALDEALKIWNEVDIEAIRAKSLGLTNFFIACLEASGLTKELKLATPKEANARGSQISLKFGGDGYAVMQALISKNVIGDYRDPNILRFGFAPLYNTYDEIYRAVSVLAEIIELELWNDEKFKTRKAVT